MLLPTPEESVSFGWFFRIKLIQCKLLVYILGILSRIIIWNKTAKQVILDTSDPQISEIEIHGVGKKLASMSKRE